MFEAASADEPQAFDLPARVRIETLSTHSELEAPNVVAALPGSDPSLRNEFVVYTAHLDHEGIGEPAEGDSIYNGALDNASGVAVMLEIARAFSLLDEPPPRSILFVAVAAEEEGLLGSDYFAQNPTVTGELVANINLDGAPLLYPIADIVPIGAEHSSLDGSVRRAAARLGLEVSPDPYPEQVFFIRSDQYSFVRQGVPAVFVMEGFKTDDPDIDGEAVFNQWMQTLYHSPKDDLNQPMNFESATKHAHLNFLMGLDVANDPARPEWNEGDFFGRLYGKDGGQ